MAPYNGFGSLEDSMQSCQTLIPQPPKKDFIKMLEYDGTVLRFEAVLVRFSVSLNTTAQFLVVGQTRHSGFGRGYRCISSLILSTWLGLWTYTLLVDGDRTSVTFTAPSLSVHDFQNSFIGYLLGNNRHSRGSFGGHQKRICSVQKTVSSKFPDL